MQAHLDLLAVLIKIRIVVLIIMTDVKVEAKAVEGAKQVSWFDPTLKDLINKHITMIITESRVTYSLFI